MFVPIFIEGLQSFARMDVIGNRLNCFRLRKESEICFTVCEVNVSTSQWARYKRTGSVLLFV